MHRVLLIPLVGLIGACTGSSDRASLLTGKECTEDHLCAAGYRCWDATFTCVSEEEHLRLTTLGIAGATQEHAAEQNTGAGGGDTQDGIAGASTPVKGNPANADANGGQDNDDGLGSDSLGDDDLAPQDVGDDGLADDDGTMDDVEGQALACDFGEARAVDIQGVDRAYHPSLAPDGLTLYFETSIDGRSQVWRASRTAPGTRSFSSAEPLRALVGEQQGTPFVSRDGRYLYFFAGWDEDRDLYRVSLDENGGRSSSEALSDLNSNEQEHAPWVSTDGSWVVFGSFRRGSGYQDLWTATQASDGSYRSPERLEGTDINTEDAEGGPFVTEDGLTLYFSSDRSGSDDLWRATRATTAADFSTPERLASLSSSRHDWDPSLSLDESELFFCSDRDGSFRIYQALCE